MRWVVAAISIFLQTMFGSFAAGGLVGLIAIVRAYLRNSDDDNGPLALVAVLCACAIFVGVKGIFVTRVRARGEELSYHDFREYKHRTALGNVVAGMLLIATGGIYVFLGYWAKKDEGAFPGFFVGFESFGITQLSYGIRQYRSRAKRTSLTEQEDDI